MATQTVEIKGITTGQTLTAKLFAHGSDTVLATGLTMTELTNKNTHYRFDTTEAITGWHDIVVSDADGSIGTWEVNLTNTTSVHYAVVNLSGTTVGTVNALAADVLDDIAGDVWAYTSRTLTHPTVTLPATVEDSDVTVYRGTKWSIAFTNLGALTGWTKLYFTVRTLEEQAEMQSQVQIKLTTPSAGTDGLLYLNGSSSGLTASHGSITVDDEPTGDITISLAAAASTSCQTGTYYYDVKMITASNVTLLTVGGKLTILPDITRAVS